MEIIKKLRLCVKSLFWASIITALIVFELSFAHAEYIPPALVSVKTKAYTPEHTSFDIGTYKYSVRWQGIPVAGAEVRIKEEPELQQVSNSSSNPYPKNIRVTATAHTAKVIDLFYRLRHKTESVFDSQTLRPESFNSHQIENSRTKIMQVAFGSNGDIAAQSWKEKKGVRAADEKITFHSENMTFDPVSAAFLARSLPVSPGVNYTFDVFNGKHRYLVTLEVVGRQQIRVQGQSYDTYKVIPKVEKLTDSKGEDRLKSAAIWVTADSRRNLVKLESEVLVGKVSVELVSFTSGTTEQIPGVRAALKLPEGLASVKPEGQL